MSNYHDIRCLTCKGHPGAGWSWNHGDEALGHILDSLPLILAAMPMLKTLDVTQFKIGYVEGGYMDSVEFLAEHAEHELAVVDEYGKVGKRRVTAEETSDEYDLRKSP